MAESSAGSSFDCLICSESFKVNDDLVDHLCEHLSYRKYRCGSCEKTFITERMQKKHCEKNSHFRIYQPSINPYKELLLEQFQVELAFLRGGGGIDQLSAFKQNSLLNLQNIMRDPSGHGQAELPVLSTSTNSAKEVRVMSSSPQDANRVVNKKSAASRALQSARSIVRTEIVPSPPSLVTNNTKAANSTTPSPRCRGTTWYAQPKPIPLGSSDSESDDDDSTTLNTQSREDVAQRKVTLPANSSAVSKTSISTPKSTVVRGVRNVYGDVVKQKCSTTSSPVVAGSSAVNKKIATSGTEQNTQPTPKSATTTNRSLSVVNNITLSHVLHRTIDTGVENTTIAKNTSTSVAHSSVNYVSSKTHVLTPDRCDSGGEDDEVSSSAENLRRRKRIRTFGKSMYGEPDMLLKEALSGSKMSSLGWIFKPAGNVTCQLCHSDGPGDYVSRRQHVSYFHLEKDDLTLKRYFPSLEAQMQNAYPGMTYSDLHCQYPGCPEREYHSENSRRMHIMREHSAFDLCCVIDGCSFLSTNAPEMELHFQEKHAMPDGSKSLSPLLAASFVSERRSKHRQRAVVIEFCFPCAIPLHLASRGELNKLLDETRFREDLDLFEASLSVIFGANLQNKDCNDEEVSNSGSESSTSIRAPPPSCSSANDGLETTIEIAIDPTISPLNWELFLQSIKATCQFCNHEGSGDYVYRKYHVASKHMNHEKLGDTDYYDVLQTKMIEAYPGMTFSDMQCQYPGCVKMYTRQDSRYTHVWRKHTLKDMRCIFRECTFLSSCAREMEEHVKVAHNQPNGSNSLGILEVVTFVSVRRRKIRQVAAMVECCFPCPIPLHASKAVLKQLMIDALGYKARQKDESEVIIPKTPNSNKPAKSLKRRRARPDEFNDRFKVVERLPLAMRTITPEDRARMMRFAPMKRRFGSSSESESDDEEETTEAAQGVLVNNDEDGKVITTNGTAAKVSKIEIILSDSDDSDVDESHNDRTPVVEAKKNRRTAGRSSVGS